MTRAEDRSRTTICWSPPVRTARIVLLTILAAVLLGTPLPAISVDPDAAFFDQYGREEGLSSSAVSSIVQDDRGFIWFGTQGGLNRFDGTRVRSWEHEPFTENQLPHDLIQTMYRDPSEPYIWLGTYRGVSRFNLDTGTFTNWAKEVGNPNSLSNDVVTAIVRDRDGTLWVGTLEGLNRLDPATGHVERTLRTRGIPGLPDETIRALHIDERGYLWIGSYGGLAVLDPQRDRIRSVLTEEELPAAAVMSIQPDPEEERLWLGVWGTGLVRYDIPAEFRDGEEPAGGPALELFPLGDDRVYTVLPGPDRYVFAGSWGGGLYRVDRVTGEVDGFRHEPSQLYSLSHDTVYSLAFDDSGALWIGTNGGGVNRLSENKRNYLRFRHEYQSPAGVSQGRITAIRRDSYGSLWIGTYNGGLNRYDAERDEMIHYRADPSRPAALSNDIITAIYEDSQRNLWIATNEGLNRYIRERDSFETFHHDPEDDRSIPGDIIYDVEETAEGVLWIGSYGEGVSRWDRRDNSFRHYSHDPDDPASLSDNLVYDILEDSRGRIWVATNRGLNRYDRGTGSWVRYSHTPGTPGTLSSNSLRVLHESSKGVLYIGTVSGGLNIFEPEREGFRYLSPAGGLPDNTITAIEEDDAGRIWLATEYGLAIYDPETGAIENLDEDDGIGGMEFNAGSFKDGDGTLWFGGNHGVTAITDPLLAENTHPPQIHITGIDIMSRPYRPEALTFTGQGLELGYEETTLGLEFASLDFAAPGRNRYRYQLEGFDTDWIDNGTRGYTTYTNLPPGTYTFRVDGSNNDGLWSGNPAELTLHVQTPPHLRWWAFLVYAAAGIFLVFTVLRLRDRRILARRVEQLDVQRTQLESDNRLLGRMSLTDPLTGVYNRRYFDWRLQDSWDRAAKSGWAISLIMVDVDRFKNFNDRYGHPEGDSTLRHVADLLTQRVSRASDVVARYGGEEFGIILHGVDEEGARQVAENICGAVAEARIPHDASDVSDIVTVTAGFCTVTPGSGGSPKALVAGSDRALYAAKDAGRNQVRSCRDR